MRNSSADTKVQGEEEGGGDLGSGVEIPQEPMMKTIPWRSTVKQITTLKQQPLESYCWSTVLAGNCSLQKGVRSGAGFADRSCEPMGDSVPEGLHPEGGTHAGTFLEENTHGEVHGRSSWEKFIHIPWVRPPCWSRRRT